MIDKNKLSGAIYHRQTGKLFWMFLVLLNVGCTARTVSQSSGSGPPANSAVPIASPSESAEVIDYIPDQFGEPLGAVINTYTTDGKLSYRQYEILKSTRKSSGAPQDVTDVEYAVLRRNGRLVAKFDSPIDELC